MEKGTVRLYASKTENERRSVKVIERVIRARVRQELSESESLSTNPTISGSAFVFARATWATSDNTIARPVSELLVWPSLNYKQANGWICHSVRHTFITHPIRVTGNDVGTVMKYSGQKTLKSFSNYIHPADEGRIVSFQALDNVGRTLKAPE